MGLDSPQQACISQMQGLRTALLDSMGAACQDRSMEGGGVNLQQRDRCRISAAIAAPDALREKMQQRREQGDAEGHKLARTDDDHRPSEYHGRAC